jgi:hypothetical protein
MAHGLFINNSNGKRVIGSDTVSPRFIGKFSVAAIDAPSSDLFGDFLKFSVTCPGKPQPFLFVPVGYSASVNRIIKTGPTAYDIFVFIPFCNTPGTCIAEVQGPGIPAPAPLGPITLSDITLYLFSDENTIETGVGYGMKIKKADGEVAFDTGFSHERVKFQIAAGRNKFVVVGPGEAAAFSPGDTVFNTSKADETIVVTEIPFGDVIAFDFVLAFDPTGDWAPGDFLSLSAGGPTLATISLGVIASVNRGQTRLLVPSAPGITFAALGIARPALFDPRQGQGFLVYYSAVGFPLAKFFHMYFRDTFVMFSNAIGWGPMIAKDDTVLTFAALDINAALRVGNFGSVTHSLFDTCVTEPAAPVAFLVADYYGTVSQVVWNQIDSKMSPLVIDGADYD